MRADQPLLPVRFVGGQLDEHHLNLVDKSQAQKVRDQLRLKDAVMIQLPSAWCG